MAAKRLILLAVLLGLCCLGYMTLGARGSWSFILPFRGTKLAALLIVGAAISTATVLFQTLTTNRILTPSIMGFDALYMLILVVAVYFLGGQGYIQLPAELVFLVNVIAMTGAALLLFGTLLGSAQGDLMRMILTGIIFGTLFRSLSSFLTRMIDPNEFTFIQVGSFAQFNRVNTDLLTIGGGLLLLTLGLVWRMRARLDVIALGRDAAVGLGVDHRVEQIKILILISVLISVSTALVGPVAFLGLLVVSLAHLITPSARHAVILPSAALIAAITLIGGQAVLERVFKLTTPLSAVIDLFGGALFLFLLLRGTRK